MRAVLAAQAGRFDVFETGAERAITFTIGLLFGSWLRRRWGGLWRGRSGRHCCGCYVANCFCGEDDAVLSSGC